MKPHILYAAYRGNAAAGSIYAWDLRGPLNTPTDIFRVPCRNASRTNQRLHFDLDITGRWLATGDHDGNIATFGLNESETDLEHTSEDPTEDRQVIEHQPTICFKAHDGMNFFSRLASWH